MKFVYILEDEARFQKELTEALFQVDPKIQIRIFSKLEDFASWIKLMMQEGPLAIAKGGTAPSWVQQEPVTEGEHQLALIVSKIEFLGAKQLSLLKKTQKLFIEKGICTAEDPTSIVLSVFDDPAFEIRKIEDRILSNIIFKPFDRLILEQHLTFAVDGRHPPSKYSIQNQKTTAVIEMLKDVPIEQMTETGFVTNSNRPIEPGSVAKYYGPVFKTDRHKSLIGVCEQCDVHPTKTGEYQVYMRLFAADAAQISAIRKEVRSPQATPSNYKLKTGKADKNLKFIIVDPDEVGSSGLSGTITRKFKNADIVEYVSLEEFMMDLDPKESLESIKKQPPIFERGQEAVFEFEPSGKLLLQIRDAAGKDQGQAFGKTAKEIMNADEFIWKSLQDEGRVRWKKIFHGGLAKEDSTLFMLIIGSYRYLISVQKVALSEDKSRVLVSCAAASKDEWLQYLRAHSKLSSHFDAVLLSHRFLGEKPGEIWTFLKTSIEKQLKISPKGYLITTREYSDEEERVLASSFEDIFFRPVDRNYFALKILHKFPGLIQKENDIFTRIIEHKGVLKVANPVTVKEMSEAGFIMEYYRAMSIGSFREMVLWQPYEIGAPELLANCNYTEEVQGSKGVFLNHFVFFGMTDHFLKNIRIWLRNNYVLAKEKG